MSKPHRCDIYHFITMSASVESVSIESDNLGKVGEPRLFMPNVGYDMEVVLSGKSKFEKTAPISDWLKDELTHGARFDLVSVTLTCLAKKEGAAIACGFSAVGASLTTEIVSLQNTGWQNVATAYNRGTVHKVELMTPPFYSQQIFPISAMVNSFNFHFVSDGEYSFNLSFKVKRTGPQIIYRSLN